MSLLKGTKWRTSYSITVEDRVFLEEVAAARNCSLSMVMSQAIELLRVEVNRAMHRVHLDELAAARAARRTPTQVPDAYTKSGMDLPPPMPAEPVVL